MPIQIWDEARLAINAYEMLHDGDLIVTHYNGEPDMWNTKPPLLIWVQVLFMKLIGVSELSVRLPSAFAGLFTSIFLLVFLSRYSKESLLGFVAALTLVTFHGYVQLHATRTGDYDAMLTMFLTLGGLSFFAYTESRKNLYLYAFFILTALAVLTKSIQGLMFLPGLFLFAVYKKQLIPLLKNRRFYFGMLSFATVVLTYYLLREVQNSGYIAAVQENELLGRYAGVLEDNRHGFGFYFGRIGIWIPFVAGGLISGFYSREERIRNISIYSFFIFITYLLIISLSQTKCAWYDVPLYPFIAILTAVFIRYLWQILCKSGFMGKKLNPRFIPYIFVFILALYPYFSIIKSTFNPTIYPKRHSFYEVTRFLQAACEGKHMLDHKYFLYDGYDPHNEFYIRKLNDNNIELKRKDWKKLDPSDLVIVSQENVKQFINTHYYYEVIQRVGNIETYRIHERKDET